MSMRRSVRLQNKPQRVKKERRSHRRWLACRSKTSHLKTRQLKLPPSQTGVVVTELNTSSAAAAAGIREGDVIQEFNRKPVRNVEQFRHALAATANQAVLLLVNRGGTTHFVVIEP